MRLFNLTTEVLQPGQLQMEARREGTREEEIVVFSVIEDAEREVAAAGTTWPRRGS